MRPSHVLGQFTASLVPWRRAARTIRSASYSDDAIGFSIITWAPASAHASTTSPWREFSELLMTMSGFSSLRSLRQSLYSFLTPISPSAVLTVWARLEADVTLISAASGSVSAIATISTFGSSANLRISSLTCMWATPTTATRYDFGISGRSSSVMCRPMLPRLRGGLGRGGELLAQRAGRACDRGIAGADDRDAP